MIIYYVMPNWGKCPFLAAKEFQEWKWREPGETWWRAWVTHGRYVNLRRPWINKVIRGDLKHIWGKGRSINRKTHFIWQHSVFRVSQRPDCCTTFTWSRNLWVSLLSSTNTAPLHVTLLQVAFCGTCSCTVATLKPEHGTFHVVWDTSFKVKSYRKRSTAPAALNHCHSSQWELLHQEKFTSMRPRQRYVLSLFWCLATGRTHQFTHRTRRWQYVR